MATVSSDLLRRDVRVLGEMLGDVITKSVGPEALELVETVRRLARRRRGGDPAAETELAEQIAKLSLTESRVVARAFSVYFDLANLAEDRHRIRVLRARELEAAP
ncbi:MAG: phosphoenolpyruvate carboxylase [Pirellulales bacterium]